MPGVSHADEIARLRTLLGGAANVIEAVRTLLVDRHQLYAQAVSAGQIPPGAPELIRIDEVMAVLVAGASVGLDEVPTVTEEGSRPWGHPGHNPVQHRDRKPPWCNTCGWSSPVPGIPAQQHSRRP